MKKGSVAKPLRRSYYLEIKPALEPAERHCIEDCLKKLGYHVIGGGTDTNMSCCDISFEIIETDLKE